MPRFEANFFGLFHIFKDRLYFFSKFGNQTTPNNEGMALNLGTIHVYDMKNGYKETQTTSNLPSFYYSPPANSTRVVSLILLC